MAATCWLVTIIATVGGTCESGSKKGKVTGQSVFGQRMRGGEGGLRVTVVVGSDGSDDSVVKLFDQLS